MIDETSIKPKKWHGVIQEAERRANRIIHSELKKIDNYLYEKMKIRRIERKAAEDTKEIIYTEAKIQEIEAFREWLGMNIRFFNKGE